MNILIVSELFYPELRGGEIVLWRVAKGLAGKGHRVRVLTSKLDDNPDVEEISGVEIHRPCKVGVKGKSRSFGAIIEKFRFMRELYEHLSKLIQEERPDIIYNNAYTATIPAGFAGKRYGLAVATNIGNLQGFEHLDGQVNPLVGAIQALKEAIVLRFGGHHGIRVASEAVAKKIESRCKVEVFRIPSPIDVDLIREVRKSISRENLRDMLGAAEDELLLLYVGALEKVKNLSSLLKVLATVSRPYKFVIVGEGREKEKLSSISRELGIDNRVDFLGRKENRRVLELMAASDALLLASISENLPTVVLEALAVNTPVVATDVGGISEIESRNLTTVDSVEAIGCVLEDGISSFSDDRILRNYSQESIANRFEAMFKEILDNVDGSNEC